MRVWARRAVVAVAGLAVGLVGLPAAGAATPPRPPTVLLGGHCRGEVDPPRNGFTTIWSDLWVRCDVPVYMVERLEIHSSYLLPGGAGDRVVSTAIGSRFGTEDHLHGTARCRWTATGVGGFYYAQATLWVIYRGQSSIARGRTEALPLPCTDTSIPGS